LGLSLPSLPWGPHFLLSRKVKIFGGTERGAAGPMGLYKHTTALG